MTEATAADVCFSTRAWLVASEASFGAEAELVAAGTALASIVAFLAWKAFAPALIATEAAAPDKGTVPSVAATADSSSSSLSLYAIRLPNAAGLTSSFAGAAGFETSVVELLLVALKDGAGGVFSKKDLSRELFDENDDAEGVGKEVGGKGAETACLEVTAWPLVWTGATSLEALPLTGFSLSKDKLNELSIAMCSSTMNAPLT